MAIGLFRMVDAGEQPRTYVNGSYQRVNLDDALQDIEAAPGPGAAELDQLDRELGEVEAAVARHDDQKARAAEAATADDAEA